MNFLDEIKQSLTHCFAQAFPDGILDDIPVSWTKPDIAGDVTITLFPLLRTLKSNPSAIAEAVKPFLNEQKFISGIELTGGFLNVIIKPEYWQSSISESLLVSKRSALCTDKIIVEFCSPNTNKPIHLGHVRNIMLGNTMANVFEYSGNKVIRVQVINDRGIAICKSMLMYQLYGDNAKPSDLEIKGDHYVGELYVRFEKEFKVEYSLWQQSPAAKRILTDKNISSENEESFFKAYKNDYFNQYSALGRQARTMLRLWEQGDSETTRLWKLMNRWVYEGFDETLHNLQIKFDHTYYESNTYLLGKELITEGLSKGVFVKDPDGSVWIDLTDQGLDRKLVLRADGTSVYITQDIGTAVQRYEDLGFDRMVYVVADEQNYHFDVLFKIVAALGYPFAGGMYHLSYGMVELPEGKMKSREGTVVDADDLMQEVITEAAQSGQERGDLQGLSDVEKEEIFRKIGLGALKYHMLRVNARKRMIFDPKESVEMQGQTGPYIQNAYVRIQSILRKSDQTGAVQQEIDSLTPQETELVKYILRYDEAIQDTQNQYDPSSLANYLYNLAKVFHKFYHDVPVNSAPEPLRSWRFTLIGRVAEVLKHGSGLMGIEMPDRM